MSDGGKKLFSKENTVHVVQCTVSTHWPHVAIETASVPSPN